MNTIVNTGWAPSETHKIVPTGNGSAVAMYPSHFGTNLEETKIALDTTVRRDGSGQILTATPKSTSFVNIVSIFLSFAVRSILYSTETRDSACPLEPKACGRPEQPPNSTITSENFNVGAVVEYSCDEGHLLVGPASRTCLPSGFYEEFPPVCKSKNKIMSFRGNSNKIDL